jgi:SAM-dependent methyltransferase
MKRKAEDFYDKNYHDRQRQGVGFEGKANLIKFERYVHPIATVLDFGCGCGFLLNAMQCAGKIGVEINDWSREYAARSGIETQKDLSKVRTQSVDLCVSDNALEHTSHPLVILDEIYRVLRPGGAAVFVVPCESVLTRYRKGDPDMHLYSWSPGALANLFTVAGFEVVTSRPFLHRWPPYAPRLRKYLGWRVFHILCRIYGALYLPLMQVRIVAMKPMKC